MAIDIDQLRADVLKRHNLALGRDDPIFATVLLNEAMLAHFTGEMAKIVEHARNEASAGTVQHIEAAKITAERLVTDAAAYIKKQTEEAFEGATTRLLERLDLHGQAMSVKLEAAARLQRLSYGSAAVSIAAVLVVAGVMLGHFAH